MDHQMQATYVSRQLAALTLLLGLLGGAPCAADVLTGLVLNVAYGEAGGLKAYDTSGKNNHGTLAAGATRVLDVYGPAMKLVGATGYLDFGDVPALDVGTGNFTLSIWVKPTTISAYIMLMVKDNFSGDGNGLFLYAHSAGSYRYWNGTSDLVIGTTTLTWTHVAATRTGTTMATYLNCVPGMAGTDTRTLTNTFPFRIGTTADNQNTLDGLTMDGRVYTRALSPQEVCTVYESKLVKESPLHQLAQILAGPARKRRIITTQ